MQFTRKTLATRLAAAFLSMCMTVSLMGQMYVPAAADMLGQVAWDTGIAAVGQFVPNGRVLSPVLSALGKLFGITASNGPSLTQVSDQVSALSKNLQEFRQEMNLQLNSLSISVKNIDDKLNTIKDTQFFVNGVGSEFDKLHTMIGDSSGKRGFAAQLELINSNSAKDANQKAIETAYLIGDNRMWETSGSFMFIFNNINDLMSGKTYRDMQGRNLYQVLNDEAVRHCMFTGEVYDEMAPYIDRMTYDYFYAYSVIAQCLSAHLRVAQLSDDQVMSYNDDALYKRYKDCKTDAAIVKSYLDAINAQTLDGSSPTSVISLYSTFKFKQKYDRFVYINKGTAEIQLLSDLAEVTNEAVPFSHTGNTYNVDIHYYSKVGYIEYDYPKKIASMNTYYKRQEEFLSDSTHLDTNSVKTIYDYANSKNMTFMDLLDKVGFDVGSHRSDNSYFALSGLKEDKEYNPRALNTFYWFVSRLTFYYNSFDPRKVGNNLLNRNIVRYDQTCEKTGGLWMDYWYKEVYADTILGIRKFPQRLKMPETAAEASSAGPDYGRDFFEPYVSVKPKGNPMKTMHIGGFVSNFSFSDVVDYKITYRGEDISGRCKGQWQFYLVSDGIDSIITPRGMQRFSTLKNISQGYPPGPEYRYYKVRIKAMDSDGKIYYSDWADYRVHDSRPEQQYNAGASTLIEPASDGGSAYGVLFDVTELIDSGVAFHWEAKETEDVTITSEDLISFSKPGVYHIRLVGDDGECFTEWIEIIAADEDIVTVIFNSNGGTAVSSQLVANGGTVKKPDDPTKTNSVFDKWYSDAALTKPYDFDSKVTGNITIYAGWNDHGSVTKPTVSGKYVYDGTEKKVALADFDSEKMTLGGTVSAAAAGTYTVTVSLKDGFAWSDGTTDDITLTWQITPAPATKYTVTAPAGITVSTTSAQHGDTITVTMNDQTIAVINSDGREIARISGYSGTFTMPASNVTLSVIPTSNMFAGKNPNSYVYVCDADMNPIMMRASNTGSITLKLGSENAGKTVTLYAEKNSTKTKLAEATADEDGNVTLTIDCGKNYTLVIE